MCVFCIVTVREKKWKLKALICGVFWKIHLLHSFVWCILTSCPPLPLPIVLQILCSKITHDLTYNLARNGGCVGLPYKDLSRLFSKQRNGQRKQQTTGEAPVSHCGGTCSDMLAYIFHFLLFNRRTAVAQWLRCCATNRKIAGSVPAGDTGIFHWHNPSDRTMVLGSTQPNII